MIVDSRRWTASLVTVTAAATLAAITIIPCAARAQYAAPPPQPPPPPGYPPPPPPPPPYYAQPYAAAPPPPPGYYAPPPQLAGFHRHDGTYVRLQIGGGFTSFKAHDSTNDIEFSGGSVNLNVAVGGAITDNVILYGEFFFADADQPDVKLNGTSLGSLNGSVDIGGLGGGIAYYFPDPNVYIAGTLAATKIDQNDSNGNTMGSTNWGIGFSGLVGKEWWVSPDWGLGLAGQLIVASMKDSSNSGAPTWTALSLGLLFSATYN